MPKTTKRKSNLRTIKIIPKAKLAVKVVNKVKKKVISKRVKAERKVKFSDETMLKVEMPHLLPVNALIKK